MWDRMTSKDDILRRLGKPALELLLTTSLHNRIYAAHGRSGFHIDQGFLLEIPLPLAQFVPRRA